MIVPHGKDIIQAAEERKARQRISLSFVMHCEAWIALAFDRSVKSHSVSQRDLYK